ncbi:UDP-N-acetylmuramoyl-tripeptide--D-alanyl-D-alanine ligase [Megasphaera sp.]|uniref:UDP-N-acetylmuramoyl-tripeptide--D-alanyl-D- alanine ligase n=1 Tax=Megasphaera sp. TaxID=2023260 RepID=UPI0025D880F4|nr:UDP-N-acetylmuramoyl-tripeptide--D-alanyl-D-alanine ligase [uncultured Megasphaera sp.]
MADFTSEEILEATGARLLKPAASLSFHDVCTDTRAIAKGSLFVAFKGTSFNGHDFVTKALDAGAAGAVVSEVRPEYEQLTAPLFVVASTLKAYQDLARFHRRRFSIPVIAVTGSVGKTSTRNMIATVLSEKYKVLQTEKNFNNEIGLPKTLLQLTPQHEACVVEMGMRGLGQIAELAAIGEPTVGVVTNVGKSHIELLGSQENIAKAKSELVRALDEKGTAVLNGDDHFVAAMTSLCRGRSVLYGTGTEMPVRAEKIVCDQQGVRFVCHCFGSTFDASLPVIGGHNVYNALAAIAVGHLTGLSDAELQRGLAAYRGMPMRQELLHLGPYTFINDTYNANPASMAEAIRTLDLLTKGRRIAVLGGMGELGDWAKKEHQAIGRLVAQTGLDALITMGDLAKDIAAAAKAAGMSAVYVTDTHEEAAKQLQEIIRDGDTVLLKGSRSFAMEKILPYFERK